MPKWLTNPVAEIWPGLTDEEHRLVTRWVERAEVIISTRFPTLDKRIAAGKISAAAVAGVVEDMVGRALSRHQRGGLSKLQYPETMMEWEDSGALGQGNTLWLTTDEVVLLSPPRSAGIRTIRPKMQPILPESRM